MSLSQTVTIADGVLIEEVGDDLMVMLPRRTEVVTLSGDIAHVVRELSAGNPVHPSQTELSQLRGFGILSPPATLSRRGVIVAGITGLGVGIAVQAMPSVALASSSPIGCQPGTPLTGFYFGNNSTATFFVGSITDGQNEKQIGVLSVYVDGQRFASVSSNGGPSGIYWSVPGGFAARDIGAICGNVTIDTVFYQVNFVFNGE